MLVLESLSPFSKNQATWGGGDHVAITANKIITCAQLATAINKIIQTLYGKKTCQTFTNMVCQTHILYSHLLYYFGRDLNYGPLPLERRVHLQCTEIFFTFTQWERKISHSASTGIKYVNVLTNYVGVCNVQTRVKGKFLNNLRFVPPQILNLSTVTWGIIVRTFRQN
jgi:hypothetical protein